MLAIHAYIEVADLALGIEFYIVAGRRGLEEEPLASQHPDPGVQESSHLIESGRDGLGRWVAGPRCQQYQRNRHSSLIRRLHGLDEFTGPGTPFRENPECGRKWHIHTVHSFGR